MYKYFYIGFTLVLFFAQPLWAEEHVLHEAKYRGNYKGLNINMTKKILNLGENQYRIVAHAKNFLGSIHEEEEFTWNKNGEIIPMSYKYTQRLFGSKRERSIRFDWKNGIAINKDKKGESNISLSPGVLGPMSYQLKLQLDLLGNQTSLDYRLISRGKIKQYNFTTAQTINETSGSNKNDPLHLQRSNESGNRQTHIWLDSSQHYTLVTLQQIKDKEVHTLHNMSSEYYPPFNNTFFDVLMN